LQSGRGYKHLNCYTMIRKIYSGVAFCLPWILMY
jgi:hypothetical protein